MPAGLLGDLGEVSYNGYRFNNTTRTTGYTVRPVPDSSNRTIAYRECELSLQTYIDARSTTDPEVKAAVESLSQSGGRLVYHGRGLGNPDVNTGNVLDVKWGPDPGMIKLAVVGAGNAVKLSWSVTFRLPPCDDGADQFAAMELAYTVEHLVDDAGYVTRTLHGHLSVPITWDGDTRELTDSADEYRLALTPPLVKNFQRTYGPWVLSEDRTRLDFVIIDTERGGEPLPPGVVEADFSETVGSTQAGLTSYTGTFSGSYRLARGENGLTAVKAFFDRVTDRITAMQAEVKKLPKKEQNLGMIPVGFQVTWPNAYGKPACSVSLTYTFVSSLPKILKVSGVFVPLNKNTWLAWAQSLADSAFHPYGGSRLRFRLTDDVLTDLCDHSFKLDKGNPDAMVNQEQWEELRNSNTFPTPPAQIRTSVEQMMGKAFPVPTPQLSWLKYESSVWNEMDNGVFPARLLPAKPLTEGDDVFGRNPDFGGQVDDAFNITSLPNKSGELPAGPGQPGGILESSGDATPLGSLRRVAAMGILYLRGSAVRAQYPVDIPRLLDVNGVAVVPANRADREEGFVKGVFANAVVPLHYARWNLRYLVPRMTGEPLQTPPNPWDGDYKAGPPTGGSPQ